MRWFVGSDHGGVALRRHLIEHLVAGGHEVVAEHGPAAEHESCDYPDIAREVCRAMTTHPSSFGLLVCGTGQGMAMTANRIKGIRAAVAHDAFSAQMAREHNDANVLCLGQRVVGVGLAVTLLNTFVSAVFEGDRHARRVGKIEALDVDDGVGS